MVEYNAQSIETLSFRDAIRTRVAMYMGSADNMGVLQCLREIITNSIDEATMGFGKKITVELFKNNRVRIPDEGRGCPFGKREDGTEALEAIYTMAHSGAKFNDKVFQNVAGMNGIGAKGVALSSDYFVVTSFREGKRAVLHLEKGIKTDFFVEDQVKEVANGNLTGTIVEFVPSQEVYNLEPIKINFEEVKKMCRDWSYLSKGISFVLIDHTTDEKVTYLSKNGMLDFMKENADKALHKTPLHITLAENGIEAEIVMEWTNSRSENWHVFTNGLENSEGGTSLTGIKTALTNYFKKKLKGEGSPDVLRKGLFYAVSCKVPNPSFANQTKTKINNPELRGLCQRATTQMLEEFEYRHGDEFQKILELLTKELKAEQAAERARKQVLEAVKDVEKNQKKKVFASDKLKDAEFLGENSTLLIVEGDSAMGGMSQGRDYTRYGLMAIRGKIINALSNPDEKVYENEEIKLLLSAMNIIPGKYDSKKLRYGKLAICTDADSDGYHIGLLIMAALAHIAPQFIREGRLCWLRSPLWIVKNGKTETYFFTDEEFNAVRGKIKGEVQRNKGLGSLEPQQARRSMFDPEYQRLDIMEYNEEAMNLLYALMGEDVAPRREFIMENVDFSEIRE
jgi:DNA gyrase/topoisomerase IV subunit B